MALQAAHQDDYLTLTVPGDPIAKGRPIWGRGRTYTPERTLTAEAGIGMLARAQLRSKPPIDATHGVMVGIDFHMRTRRRVDIDNLAKLVLDALNGIAWEDDVQVVALAVTKQHDPKNPRTRIRVRDIAPGRGRHDETKGTM